MSKLLKLIEVRDTGRRSAPPLDFIASMVNIDKYTGHVPYGREYRIKATFGANVVVTDEMWDGIGLEYAINQVHRSVVEAVFGEFRVPLREIRKALWEKDLNKVNTLLQELEVQMFTDE